jgi:hypothetical protein
MMLNLAELRTDFSEWSRGDTFIIFSGYYDKSLLLKGFLLPHADTNTIDRVECITEPSV